MIGLISDMSRKFFLLLLLLFTAVLCVFVYIRNFTHRPDPSQFHSKQVSTSPPPSSVATTSNVTPTWYSTSTFFSAIDFGFSHLPTWIFEKSAELTTDGQIAWYISTSDKDSFATLIAAPLEPAYDSCSFFTDDVERTYYRQNVGTPIEVLVCRLCPDASKAKEEKCDAAKKSVRIEILWQRGTHLGEGESGGLRINNKRAKDIRLIMARTRLNGYNESSEELIRDLKELAKTIHVSTATSSKTLNTKTLRPRQ